ncbi:hypothetical protein OSB04_010257 [Centaurea solstitialis]|uniref:Pectate lyase n=1 Tax=Centaurea solstitialis TaxID=347529 RepID=A0AA38T771_9ASTR|nr:hypothetical protein OSB04_010257 [Centaurea solstitialis]
MVIQLKQELIMNSFKTIDARGVNVHIANGACLTIQFVTNIIVHGLHIHDCKPTGNALVRSSPSHYGWRTMADGDAISIFGSSHIWIDHNSLSNCADGLVDAVMGSTAITISNNYFTHHNEVILLGHSDSYVRDKLMQVTIAYNHFGEGLIQRMPRCRHGYFHVVNNDYTHWEMYAIGGSANPTINSQGNRYLAPENPFARRLQRGWRQIQGNGMDGTGDQRETCCLMGLISSHLELEPRQAMLGPQVWVQSHLPWLVPSPPVLECLTVAEAANASYVQPALNWLAYLVKTPFLPSFLHAYKKRYTYRSHIFALNFSLSDQLAIK